MSVSSDNFGVTWFNLPPIQDGDYFTARGFAFVADRIIVVDDTPIYYVNGKADTYDVLGRQGLNPVTGRATVYVVLGRK